ncbi:hypothetical protein Pfo_004812, partial [Paulownia fortunei]
MGKQREGTEGGVGEALCGGRLGLRIGCWEVGREAQDIPLARDGFWEDFFWFFKHFQQLLIGNSEGIIDLISIIHSKKDYFMIYSLFYIILQLRVDGVLM